MCIRDRSRVKSPPLKHSLFQPSTRMISPFCTFTSGRLSHSLEHLSFMHALFFASIVSLMLSIKSTCSLHNQCRKKTDASSCCIHRPFHRTLKLGCEKNSIAFCTSEFVYACLVLVEFSTDLSHIIVSRKSKSCEYSTVSCQTHGDNEIKSCTVWVLLKIQSIEQLHTMMLKYPTNVWSSTAPILCLLSALAGSFDVLFLLSVGYRIACFRFELVKSRAFSIYCFLRYTKGRLKVIIETYVPHGELLCPLATGCEYTRHLGH